MRRCSSRVCTEAGLHYRPSSMREDTAGFNRCLGYLFLCYISLSFLTSSNFGGKCHAAVRPCNPCMVSLKPTPFSQLHPGCSKADEIGQVLWWHKSYPKLSHSLREESRQVSVHSSGSAQDKGGWAAPPLLQPLGAQREPQQQIGFPGVSPYISYIIL